MQPTAVTADYPNKRVLLGAWTGFQGRPTTRTPTKFHGHIIQCFAKASNHESIQLAFTGTIPGGIAYELCFKPGSKKSTVRITRAYVTLFSVAKGVLVVVVRGLQRTESQGFLHYCLDHIHSLLSPINTVWSRGPVCLPGRLLSCELISGFRGFATLPFQTSLWIQQLPVTARISLSLTSRHLARRDIS